MQYVVKAQNLVDGLDDFTRAYLEAAEWSGLDDDEVAALELAVAPVWDKWAIDHATADCSAFQKDNAALLEGIDPAQAGHDFWLTRNGHGAGYWDRGLGEVGDKLTDAAHVYGEAYVGWDEGRETLTLDGTYTDLPAGAGDTVIHVPEDPDGIVLQERGQPMDKLYRINDVLTALAQELGVTFTDDEDEDRKLDEATHAVAGLFGIDR